MNRFKVIATLAMLFYLPAAQALSCYEESPSYSRLGDRYFDLDQNMYLTSREKNEASAILQSLEGAWKGEIVEFECTGPDRAPREKIKQANAKATLSTSGNSLLRISLSKDYVEDSYTKNDRLDLLNKDKIFDIEISDNVIATSEKYRRKSGQDSRLVEIISRIESNDDSVRIELTHYSNGVFVFNQTITLIRD